jgi:hypothetical protein
MSPTPTPPCRCGSLPSLLKIPRRSSTHPILLPCELGCEQGFADTAHRLLHYADSECIDEELPSGECTEPGCSWVPPAGSPVKYKDHDCRLGFTSKASLRYHFLGGISSRGKITRAARGSGHCDAVLDQLLGHENIVTDV